MSYPHFLYVMSEDAMERLKSLGFSLLKEDKKKRIYVFLNKAELAFENFDFPVITSDTLTF